MNNIDILVKLGLNRNEVGIYLSLLEMGMGSVSDIAKATGISRPVIYKFIPSLKEVGLISISLKGKRILYVAESPDKLKNLLHRIGQDIDDLLPDLETTFKSRSIKPVVKYLEGKSGLQFAFEDLVTSLKKGDVYFRYSSGKDVAIIEKYHPKDYVKLQEEKQLQRLIISTESVKKSAKTDSLNREVKIVPKEYELFEYTINKVIYGDKVAFIDFNKETVFVIENHAIAEFEKRAFKLLYSKL